MIQKTPAVFFGFSIDILQVFYIITFAARFSISKLKVYYYKTHGKRANQEKTKEIGRASCRERV